MRDGPKKEQALLRGLGPLPTTSGEGLGAELIISGQ